MKVQILVDNKNSWVVSYAYEFAKKMNASLIHDHSDIDNDGDVLILLSCEKKLTDYGKNRFNLVAHASDLPEGKGWSPLTWQILEGRDKIIVSLIEAEDQIDSGVIYGKKELFLDGYELIEELRIKLVNVIFDLIVEFFDKYPHINGSTQSGESSYYKRRTLEDSMLDTSKTLDEQFDLLRVCDNERYPAFFVKNGHKYIIEIKKA